MRDQQSPRGIGRYQAQILTQNPEAALKLPKPSVEWQWRDIDIHNGTLARFSDRDLIEKGERTDLQGYRHNWHTPPHIYQYIQQEVEAPNPSTAECGHTGIVNLGNGEYTCSNDDCDARFGRTEAREVIEA